MEISKDQPNENKHRLFIQCLLHTERVMSSHCCLCFGRDSKAGRGVGSIVGGEREGFTCALITEGGQHQHQEAGGGLTRNGTSYVTGQISLFSFLWLLFNQKWEEEVENLSIINKVLAWPDCYRNHHLASWVVTRDSRMISKSLIYSSTIAWAIYCRQAVGFLGRSLQVKGQSSIFICGLAHCLNIQSLSAK